MEPAATGRTRKGHLSVPPALLLYVIAPLLLLALPLALFRVLSGLDSSLILSLFFWSAVVLLGWLSGALCSLLFHRIFARWRPPLWLITLAGPVVASVLLHRPFAEILSLAHGVQMAGPGLDPGSTLRLEWHAIDRFLRNIAPGTIGWMVINHVYDRVLGIPRYRYAGAGTALPDAAPATVADVPQVPTTVPPLLVRTSPAVERGRLLAIRAEDHYVRIFTDKGEAMRLIRLSDAIRQAEPVAGMQIHRSIWVAEEAIRSFRRTGHSGQILLSNGLELPVSRSYCQAVEKRIAALPLPREPEPAAR